MNETETLTLQPAETEETGATCDNILACPCTVGAIALVVGLAAGFVAGRVSAKKASGGKNPRQGGNRDRNGRNERGDRRQNGQSGRDGQNGQNRNREDRPARREEVVVRDRARLEEPVRGPLPPGSVELYVGNLSYATTDESLGAAFAPHGEMVQARVVLNRFNGKSKGFGFVVMKSRADAEKAIAAMNEAELDGRRLRVNEARNGDTPQE